MSRADYNCFAERLRRGVCTTDGIACRTFVLVLSVILLTTFQPASFPDVVSCWLALRRTVKGIACRVTALECLVTPFLLQYMSCMGLQIQQFAPVRLQTGIHLQPMCETINTHFFSDFLRCYLWHQKGIWLENPTLLSAANSSTLPAQKKITK